MKDTQLSLKLIVNCLKGMDNLDRYCYNRQFSVFSDEFRPLL